MNVHITVEEVAFQMMSSPNDITTRNMAHHYVASVFTYNPSTRRSQYFTSFPVSDKPLMVFDETENHRLVTPMKTLRLFTEQAVEALERLAKEKGRPRLIKVVGGTMLLHECPRWIASRVRQYGLLRKHWDYICAYQCEVDHHVRQIRQNGR